MLLEMMDVLILALDLKLHNVSISSMRTRRRRARMDTVHGVLFFFVIQLLKLLSPACSPLLPLLRTWCHESHRCRHGLTAEGSTTSSLTRNSHQILLCWQQCWRTSRTFTGAVIYSSRSELFFLLIEPWCSHHHLQKNKIWMNGFWFFFEIPWYFLPVLRSVDFLSLSFEIWEHHPHYFYEGAFPVQYVLLLWYTTGTCWYTTTVYHTDKSFAHADGWTDGIFRTRWTDRIFRIIGAEPASGNKRRTAEDYSTGGGG